MKDAFPADRLGAWRDMPDPLLKAKASLLPEGRHDTGPVHRRIHLVLGESDLGESLAASAFKANRVRVYSVYPT